MQITIKNDQLDKLIAATQKARRSLPKELAAACNKTARGMKTPISQEIRKELAVKAAVVKAVIDQTRTAKPIGILNKKTEAAVAVKSSKRIPLRDFGARQIKAGVTYRISKSGGRKRIQGAFMVAKLGNHVFTRAKDVRRNPPKYNALPISKKFGASPWGVFVKNKMDVPASKEAEQRLAKEIDRRIQYNVFKASELK